MLPRMTWTGVALGIKSKIGKKYSSQKSFCENNERNTIGKLPWVLFIFGRVCMCSNSCIIWNARHFYKYSLEWTFCNAYVVNNYPFKDVVCFKWEIMTVPGGWELYTMIWSKLCDTSADAPLSKQNNIHFHVAFYIPL